MPSFQQGSIVRQRRISLGMSKSEFARRLKCSPQNIDSIESRQTINAKLINQINIILDFSIYDFAPKDKLTHGNAYKQMYEEILIKYNHSLEQIIDLQKQINLNIK